MKLILAYTYMVILWSLLISFIAIVLTDSYIFIDLIITGSCINLIVAVLFFIAKD